MAFPQDEDGLVLQELQDEGVDFTVLHDIDFFVGAPSEQAANSIKAAIEEAEFSAEVAFDEEVDTWTVFVYVSTYLDYDVLKEIQETLDALAKPLDGFYDGWAVLLPE
ncbi:MAG: ribonuclease E inhibitor RraB [Caryophanon sp.]|nr:ribonuclease E inhibitor RraB [Caryophanon sp.]